jgi:hypothetical protein
MKLFETLSIELDTLNEYYKPHYNEVDKTPGGSVKDWFKAMKVEPKDVEEAMKLARELPSYKKLAGMFKVIQNERMNKNGTFTFETDEKSESAGHWKHPQGQPFARYIVYGNGVIRREGTTGHRNESGKGWITRLKAPKPALVHGSPVKSLVKIYDNAFKELAAKKDKPVKD